jgi:hypothetical protein
MTLTLAVVGKGGTGKTTFSALTIKYLLRAGHTPILAIDADPSANLNMALGMELADTVGQIREETRDQVTGGTFQPGISKPDWFQYQVMHCAWLLLRGEPHVARSHRPPGRQLSQRRHRQRGRHGAHQPADHP